MHQITCYVPHTHLEQVKQALFNAGAGAMDGYDHCCWQTAGQHQFRPLDNSKPTLGDKLSLTHVEEYKIEIACQAEYLEAAIRALLETHPYETPAYFIHTMAHIPS